MYGYFLNSFHLSWDIYKYILPGISRKGQYEALLRQIPGKYKRELPFVETDESQHLAVGTEFQGTVKCELFFVYPVWNAVQHFIAAAVFGHLAFAVAVK